MQQPQSSALIVGEFSRALDERYRVSIPPELTELLLVDGDECVLAKERPGCLSLWSAAVWNVRMEAGVRVVREKLQAGYLAARIGELQQFGRLLSTRQRPVQLAGRGRLVLPDGFRQFLGVEAGGEVVIVGAAVCVEIWRPGAWWEYLQQQIPEFQNLVNQLAQ